MTTSTRGTPTVPLASGEIAMLSEAMRDLQMSVSEYYSETAGVGDLGRRVRGFLTATQTVNDLLTNQIAEGQAYMTLFSANRHPVAALIEGVKFARNVQQHVLHIVRPRDEMTLIGGTLGCRLYAVWDEVPAHVVAQLRPTTQALEPRYQAELQGREVTRTMMSVLRFFAEVVPQIIHRDMHGEWTGFPLLSQPGVNSVIHPEEPEDHELARVWMDGRRPGGDCRVICGQVTVDGVPYVYGHTFIRRLSFAPFVETVEQASFDMSLGYPYLEGNIATNSEDVTDRFDNVHQGAVLQSRGDVSSWATRTGSIAERADWNAPGVIAESWEQIVMMEIDTRIPGFSFGPRRARRLNALVPPN
ncbi:MAG: hypothetical protein KF867_01055 [Cryobacterium sp.]|nr:hypothetical protein [Cryobacterium sp.]